MSNNLFIQYYGRIENSSKWYLNNGFSNTLDYCKSIGDVLWLEFDKNIQYMKLPINEGTVYISCHSTESLYVSYSLAKNNPHLSFVIGGPALSVAITVNEKIPNNIILTDKTVEEWFNIQPYSYKWKLEIPKKLKNEEIYYTYSLDNLTCYWNKCIFCSCTVKRNKESIRKDINYSSLVDIPNHRGRKTIRFGSLALKENHISIIDELPYGDFKYRSFIRGTKKETEIIKQLSTNRSDFTYSCGLEFPSERMWKFINKGYNMKDILSFISSIQGSNLHLSMIRGWSNLIDEDIQELKKFLKNMPKDVCSDISVYNLFCSKDTLIYKILKPNKHISCGPFYYGFYPQLSDKDKDLNRQMVDLIMNYVLKNKISYHIHEIKNFEEWIK